jgi:hypothetical protein
MPGTRPASLPAPMPQCIYPKSDDDVAPMRYAAIKVA